MKFRRKKQIIVDAIQFIDDSDRIAEISEFTGANVVVSSEDPDNPVLKLGMFDASVGDYIVKGATGLYLSPASAFEKAYEAVE